MKEKDQDGSAANRGDLSRREFVALSLAAGISIGALPLADSSLVETDVNVKTPDGTCDAVFIHPAKGAHPGVLIWPDSGGLRPVFRELGRRIAAEGYAVLVPNHLYRMAKAPVFKEPFDPIKNPADAAFYRRVTAPFFAAGAVERDAVAYVEFLDQQKETNHKKKLGVHGYCLGGAYVLKTAAMFPERVGAGASLHGGFLVTDKPTSPHLLAPEIKAHLYFAMASDDDKREPETKTKFERSVCCGEGSR
jgi:carboxymethylenebutenolidase